MELLDASDTNSLSYWLNWRFLLCALWVIIAMIVAAFIILKYEYFDSLESDSEGVQVNAKFWYADEAWRPCVKEISPNWLMAFRIFAFCLILTALIIDFVVQGGSMVYYYTQWTFILVTIYFGLGSVLSMYGCFQHRKTCNRFNVCHDENDAERGTYISLVYGETVNGVTREKDPDYHGKYYVFRTAMNWSHAFQILFQMTAGAVILTDSVYWCIIFPFLTAHDNRLSMLTVIEHSLNAILLLGDAALNGLRFPWFRISYFILLTGFYVIFEWILHAYVSLWWPYPILDLSSSYAPLWYLCVALLHLPCYALFALIVKTKHYVLSKRFPQSYQCLR